MGFPLRFPFLFLYWFTRGFLVFIRYLPCAFHDLE